MHFKWRYIPCCALPLSPRRLVALPLRCPVASLTLAPRHAPRAAAPQCNRATTPPRQIAAVQHRRCAGKPPGHNCRSAAPRRRATALLALRWSSLFTKNMPFVFVGSTAPLPYRPGVPPLHRRVARAPPPHRLPPRHHCTVRYWTLQWAHANYCLCISMRRQTLRCALF